MSSFLESILVDARLALRSLTRRPSLFGLSVLTLAIGIAGCVIAFSIVNSLLHYPHPRQAARSGRGRAGAC